MQVSSTFSVLKSHEKKQKPRAGSITTTPEITQCKGRARPPSSHLQLNRDPVRAARVISA